MDALRLILACVLSAALVKGAEEASRPAVVLSNEKAALTIDLLGGSIVRFELQANKINPFAWEEPGAPMAARPMGHFLCLDRWGPASKAEQANGMPFHGEGARVAWKTTRPPIRNGAYMECAMEASLPLAGLKVTRRVSLRGAGAVFTVAETISNSNKLGRLFNIVQHPTIGPPFLDEDVIVDANAGQGFMQSAPGPDPERIPVRWPNAVKDGERVDLRSLKNDPRPNVVSFVIDEAYGWVTASSPNHKLLLGYIWRRDEYPWLNIWRHVEKGKPFARGLEFGTTGLHQPFEILARKGRIFDHPLFEYLDPGETITKKYACFLLEIPSDFRGVENLRYENGRITLRERGQRDPRDLHIECGPLF